VQRNGILNRLAEKGAHTETDKEIVALIAYLQKLGTYREAGEKIDAAEAQQESELGAL